MKNNSFFAKILEESIENTYKKYYDDLITKNKKYSINDIENYIFKDLRIKNDYQLMIIILESFYLFKVIISVGLNEDNYSKKEKIFNNALLTIKELSPYTETIKMLPRPSKVKYYLSYLLNNFFKIEKSEIHYILDIVFEKNSIMSRLPKKNQKLNQTINDCLFRQEYAFNNTEGLKKFQYFGISIFIFEELTNFKNLIIN